MPNQVVSIITPSFNQGRFLKDCLDSVSLQTYPRIEHIVVDAISHDETNQVLQSWQPNNTSRVLIQEPDEGQTDALLKGFARAKGDIVCWLNADDAYTRTDSVALAVRGLQGAPKTVVYGDRLVIDEANVPRALKYAHGISRDHLKSLHFNLFQESCFWWRSTFNDVQLDRNYERCMDTDFWISLAKTGYSFQRVPHLWGTFRLQSASKTSAMTHDPRWPLEWNQLLQKHQKFLHLPLDLPTKTRKMFSGTYNRYIHLVRDAHRIRQWPLAHYVDFDHPDARPWRLGVNSIKPHVDYMVRALQRSS